MIIAILSWSCGSEPSATAGMISRSIDSFRFSFVLSGDLDDCCRRDDLWPGRLQDRVSAGRSPSGQDFANVAPFRVLVGQRQSLTFIKLFAECLPLLGQLVDPGGPRTNFLAWGKG